MLNVFCVYYNIQMLKMLNCASNIFRTDTYIAHDVDAVRPSVYYVYNKTLGPIIVRQNILRFKMDRIISIQSSIQPKALASLISYVKCNRPQIAVTKCFGFILSIRISNITIYHAQNSLKMLMLYIAVLLIGMYIVR